MHYNLGETLAHRALLSPDHDGFIGPDYRYSYAEVNDRCSRLAAWLAQSGLKPGDRIAVYGKNSEFVATTIFAASRAGVVAVVLNWRLQASELAYILNDSGATALAYDAGFAPTVDTLRGATRLSLFICNGPSAADPTYAAIMATDGLPPCPPSVRRGDDPAILMYTSGTTGKPKGAVLTHDNFLFAAHGTSSTLEWLESHRFLLVAPIFHIGGLMPLTTSVQKGTTLYFLPDFDPVVVWDVIARERITNMMSVPLMLRAMLAVAQQRPVDASSLRAIICGASVVPRPLIEAFDAMGVAVSQVYGLTEVTGALTFWKPSMGRDKAHSQGKPAYLNFMKIVDLRTGADARTGQAGEVMCRGAVVFPGYWNNPDATNSVFRDGWFATGDVGYVDEAGFLYLIDRVKDMIISGGENIYPAELEAVIAGHPAVAEVAVVGRDDAKWGEIPVAFVVPRPGSEILADEIIALCREKLAHFKSVKAVHVVDALPRNGVGKILKRELKQAATQP